MALIEIYTGHFGSGKTEIVLNRAIEYSKQGETVYLVDLDIVKPYFRAREVQHYLKESGINLITSGSELENADLPVITPKVLGVLTSAAGKVLFDVGGDPMGAAALGGFAHLIRQRGYEMFFVLNPFRPFTEDISGVKTMYQEIESASRLKINGVIANPNLSRETSLADIRLGLSKVREMAQSLAVPISFTAIMEKFADLICPEIEEPILKVTNFLLPPWDLEEGQVFEMDQHLRVPRRGEK
jgi:RecA/RadA recombinase